MELIADSRHVGDVVVISFRGDVDALTAPVFRDGISKVLAAGHHRIVCDLTGVGFMDSTGLGVLVGRLKAIRLLQGEMRVVVASERLRRNFHITGLEKILALDETVDASLEAMNAAQSDADTRAAAPASS